MDQISDLVLSGGSIEGRQALRASFAQETSAARNRVPDDIAEIRALLAITDPIRVLGALTVMDAHARGTLSGEANFGSDAMLDFLAGLVATLDEPSVSGAVRAAVDLSLLFKLQVLLRRLANDKHSASVGSVWDAPTEEAFGIASMLGLEEDFDRMSGFDPHVRRVVRAVFEKVDDKAKAQLGFRLSDALDFADLYGRIRMAQADKAGERTNRDLPPISATAGREEQRRYAATHFSVFALYAAAPLEDADANAVLAEELDLEPHQFEKLVEAMSTLIGSVDEATLENDNPIRYKPLLRLADGRWTWSRPIDFLHCALEWAMRTCQPESKLLADFDKARQAVANDLAAEVLREVFGDAVFPNVTYPAEESETEADVLVSLPGLVLLVECKGGRFSRPGRRGAPKRLEKHAKELFEDPAGQNRRTTSAIRSGLAIRDSRGNALEIDPDVDIIPITITLDRVDPLAAYLGTPKEGDLSQRSWALALSDLVMIAEVLPTPSDFVAYALKRRRMLREENTRVFVEADALGGWCVDRLTDTTVLSDPASALETRMVSNTSALMNDYFTSVTLVAQGAEEDDVEGWAQRRRQPITRPSTGLPPAALEALETARVLGDPQWATLCDACLGVAPKAWRPLTRALAAAGKDHQAMGREQKRLLRKAASGLVIDGRIQVTLTASEDGQSKPFLSLTAAPS